ncbi:bifunctional diguanylate cyclase/phosphodiesterase [Pararhodospirillum oryzae]|uniref:GGDEF domain-containing protein n=1 Tax=Pararhodospirillum oryzae TaxID=478448 RepID=A0A512HAU9_9PROT|nr:EAL domain-containing protein [Pararhodospirillum oryzae]GEO82581.1 GGDEF domain-containing protein [Pararhodospirillum oryzae]
MVFEDGVTALLSAVTDAAPEGLIVLDEAARVVVFNQAAERLFRRQRREILGLGLVNLLGDKYPALAALLGRETRPGDDLGALGKRYLTIARPDGSPLIAEMSFGSTEIDGRHHVVALVREATALPSGPDTWLETEERLGNFASNMPGIVFQRVMRPDGTLYYPFFSTGVIDILGYQPEEMTTARDGCLDAIHWADRDTYLETLRRSAAALTQCTEEYRAIARNGEVKWLSGTAQPQVMPNGDVLWDGVLIDITDRKRAELWLEMIMNHAADGIVTISEDGLIESANAAAGSVFGYEAEDLIGRSIGILMAESEAAWSDGLLQRYVQTGEGALIGTGPREMRGQRQDGSVFPLEMALSEVLTEGRRIFIAVIRDITQRKETENALIATQERLQNIADNVPGLVFQRVLTAQGELRFLYVSNGAREVLGFEPRELLDDGRLLLDAMAPDDREAFMEALKLSATRLEPMEDDIKVLSRTGEERWLRGWSRPYRLPDGSVVWEGVSLDVTDRKRAEGRLTFLAYYDPLTGLGNRSLFIERFERARLFAQSMGTWVVVLSLGLDRFSIINATIGHTMGDKVLVAVARRLLQSLDAGAIVCRAGGDRFLVMLTGLSTLPDLHEAVEGLQATFEHPIEVNGQQFDLTVSIGASVYPTDGHEAETLIMHADAALHRAKEDGGGGFQVFTEEMGARAAKMLTMQHKLRRALDRQEFMAYFQPQVDIATGAIIGCEALARWQSPDDGMVPPGVFIPVAEECGLIDAICLQILVDSCRWIAEWRSRGLPEITVAVNISGRQFHNSRQLMSIVEQTLADAGVPPRQLELELTESSAMNDPENAINVVRMFRDRGVACSIDDFGTGYSSLSVLKRFPIHKLKIDRSFVMDVTNDPNDAAIVQAIVALAHALNLKVVAEGVETLEHLEFLRSVRCDTIQGYLFSRPLPGEAMAEFLAQGKPEPHPVTS